MLLCPSRSTIRCCCCSRRSRSTRCSATCRRCSACSRIRSCSPGGRSPCSTASSTATSRSERVAAGARHRHRRRAGRRRRGARLGRSSGCAARTPFGWRARGAAGRGAAGAAQPLRPCRRGRATRSSSDGVAGGREAVSHIVGRDPASLDEHGVARAAIEIARREFQRRRGRAGASGTCCSACPASSPTRWPTRSTA